MRKIFLTLFLVLTMICGLSVTAFASGNVVPPELDSSQYDSCVILYEGNASYTCVVYKASDWDFVLNEDEGHLEWTKLRETACVRYYKSMPIATYDSSGTNNGWFSMQQYNGMATAVNMSKGTNGFIECSEDIYNTEGKKVFQGTSLAEAVQESLTGMQTTMVGQTKILVACGVGCLALLILLKVFGKVLPHSLS